MRSEAPPQCELMLEWLERLALDPRQVATATLNRRGVPAFTAAVPGTDAFVDYIVVEQYHTVMILRVTNQPLGY